jgi:hypothetical protein
MTLFPSIDDGVPIENRDLQKIIFDLGVSSQETSLEWYKSDNREEIWFWARVTLA